MRGYQRAALVLLVVLTELHGIDVHDEGIPLPTRLKKLGKVACPQKDCDFLGAPARYTGKYAVFMRVSGARALGVMRVDC